MTEDNMVGDTTTATDTANPAPTTRIRVRLDFEIEIPGDRVLPDWLTRIHIAGLEALQLADIAPDPLTYLGCRYNLSQVSKAELKRRKTRGQKRARKAVSP